MIICANDFVNIDGVKIVNDAAELLSLEGSKNFAFSAKKDKYIH